MPRKKLSDEERKERKRKYNRKYYADNSERRRRYLQEWRVSNPEYSRKYDRMRKYGMSAEDYEILLMTQNGCCAICGTDTPGGNSKVFHVDHNHATSHVRGLLCHSCNVALGHLKDDPLIVRAALEYLEDNGHYGGRTKTTCETEASFTH